MGPVIIMPIDAELDEQWSFVGNKKNPRWLWLAIQHNTAEVLAYTFGRRADNTLEKLKKLLKPFGINKYYTDNYGSYFRKLPADQHFPGKRNTQKVERKFLILRTRIKRLTRKTICFSRSVLMHDTIIGLFINKYEFEGYSSCKQL